MVTVEQELNSRQRRVMKRAAERKLKEAPVNNETQPQMLPNLTSPVMATVEVPPAQVLVVAPTQSKLEEKRLKLADRLRAQSDQIMARYRASDNKDKSMWLSVKNAFTWAYAHVFSGAAWLVDSIESVMNYIGNAFKALAYPVLQLAKKIGAWFTEVKAKEEAAVPTTAVVVPA
jgi:hypothetical protein